MLNRMVIGHQAGQSQSQFYFFSKGTFLSIQVTSTVKFNDLYMYQCHSWTERSLTPSMSGPTVYGHVVGLEHV